MRRIVLPALLILFFINGCKKSANNFELATGNTYWPVTKGSYWKYKSAFKDGRVENVNIRMTGTVTVVDEKTRYEYVISRTPENIPPTSQAIGYYIAQNGITSASVQGSTERLRLDENIPVGQPWIILKNNNYVNTGRIVETGLIRTVSGKKYINVIHVQEMEQFKPDETILVSDIYMAKGIGLIESIRADGNNIFSLVEYSIK